jgi:hypothetical protein
MGKNIAVLTRDTDRFRQSEVSRSSLGLTLGDHKVSLFIIDAEYKLNDYLAENFEWIADMDGGSYSNNPKNDFENCEQMSLEDMAKKMLENDIIIPF